MAITIKYGSPVPLAMAGYAAGMNKAQQRQREEQLQLYVQNLRMQQQQALQYAHMGQQERFHQQVARRGEHAAGFNRRPPAGIVGGEQLSIRGGQKNEIE